MTARSKPSPKPAAPETVWIKNSEPRVRRLVYNEIYELNGKKQFQSKEIVITPGASLHKTEELRRCCIEGNLGELVKLTDGNIRPISAPYEGSEWEAVELAQGTSSKSALNAWREKETREAVIKALDEQLAGGKPTEDE